MTARKGPTFPALHRAQGAVPAQAARLSRFDTSQGGAARVLVLSPHPDDELIGCGGTLCRLLSSGARACVVQATDGRGLESLRDLPEARRRSVRIEEAARVAAELGVELVAWGEEDGRLEPCSRTIGRLARLLAALRPTHIFTPFLDDRHPDHRALSRMLQAALALAPGELRVLQYEVWGRVRANTYCEVTNAMETVGRLLLLYERAMRVEDYVRMCEQRNLTNGLRLTGKPAYAEGFLCTSGAAFIELGRCVA